MTFNIIQTKRLKIRPLVIDDAKIISTYRSDPKVSEFQSWGNYYEDDALKLIKEMESASPSNIGKWFQFGIELLANKQLIGDIGFLNSDKSGKSWIGFTLDSKYWQQGYATEAVEAVLNYYKQLGILSICGSIDPENHRSQKLLQKLGFALIEEQPDDLIFQKEYN